MRWELLLNLGLELLMLLERRRPPYTTLLTPCPRCGSKPATPASTGCIPLTTSGAADPVRLGPHPAHREPLQQQHASSSASRPADLPNTCLAAPLRCIRFPHLCPCAPVHTLPCPLPRTPFFVPGCVQLFPVHNPETGQQQQLPTNGRPRGRTSDGTGRCAPAGAVS